MTALAEAKVLLLRGEPGIGKSHLLAAAADDARSRGAQVLSATGVPSEAHLPFAGLHQLLRPLLPCVRDLPEPHRAALLAAFGMTAGPQTFFFVALATLELLADAAARTPVVVVADDVHWLDQATVEVLAFVARRIAAEPITLWAATRTGDPVPWKVPELTVSGLDDDTARRLLDRHAGGLTATTRERLLTEAAGNPLALIELPVAARARRLDDVAVAPAMLPLTDRLEAAFAGRLAELPDATNALLLAVALDDGCGTSSEILAAARTTEASFQPAEAAGLISLTGGRVRFRHPLVRTAVYHRAGEADRRGAHAAWADVVTDRPERQLWHRAAAATGPDDAIADALERRAEQERGRGALAGAIEIMDRAARLTPPSGRRAGRLLDAADLAFELGRHRLVRGLVEEAGPLLAEPRERARHLQLRDILDDGRPGDVAGIRTMVEQVRRMRADGDPGLARRLLIAAARRCWWTDPGPADRHLIAAWADDLPTDERLVVLALTEPIEQGSRIIAALTDHRDQAEPALRVIAAYIVGDFERCVRLAGPAADGLRAQARLALLVQVLTLAASAAMHMGAWSRAATTAAEAVRLGVETGQPVWTVAARHVDAAMAGLRGDAVRAGEQLALIVGEDEMSGVVPSAAHQSRGLAALAAGDYAEAYRELRPIFDSSHPAYHRALRCWLVGYLAEAAVHCRRADDARQVVADLSTLAGITSSPALQISLRYARAVLADDEKLYREALDQHPPHWPFQRARLELAFGTWLRRQRRIAESRDPLRTARDLFDRIDAPGWSERARQELRATGESSQQPERGAWQRLSPQELQIATMAAEGLSNREIGQRLYVSHRTVGSHLYRLFPKLGITSRAQLRDALAAWVADGRE
ncbi:AAA family ATPase [Actinoplanes sp. TBRC 11911]|nr:LuxR family transcriptional regulator [Actinoplanes sp. TBRC 11911]NMO51561.1 AAA family ATPase [Actinoplanes sp. TBRC 11911]